MNPRQPYLVSYSTSAQELRVRLAEVEGAEFLRELRAGLAVVVAPAGRADRLSALEGVTSAVPDRLERRTGPG